MPISLSESHHETCLRNPLSGQALKHFADQFAIAGCGRFHSSRQRKPVCLEYWSDAPIADLLPDLETAIAGAPIAQPFEVVSIPVGRPSLWLYGCFHRTAEDGWLLCWQRSPLSEHQQYGISLYARALSQPADLTQTLQRTRHQLRTPIALILLYANLLKTAPNDRHAQEWLENLRTTAEGMNLSLDYLTNGTAADSMAADRTTADRATADRTTADRHADSCDLRQLMQQCEQEMQPWITEKQLTLTYDSRSLQLRVNPWKLKQVFQNLLSNAIAFSPIAGQITWEWQVFQTEVLIKISDTGTGLSTEDLRSIGTPYYSRRPGGTGLGLAIAQQIIVEHQGSLWATNLSNGGAQFCLMLPRS